VAGRHHRADNDLCTRGLGWTYRAAAPSASLVAPDKRWCLPAVCIAGGLASVCLRYSICISWGAMSGLDVFRLRVAVP
jgi:hypothetical protein